MEEIIHKLPPEFIDKLKGIYPRIYPNICQTFLHHKEQTFRINYLKTDLVNLKEALNRERIKYRQLSWPKASFILVSGLKDLQRGEIYQQGLVYVQNVSSMIPAVVLNPQPQEKILDLCAAPGAKTTQIASLAGSDIELVAVEKIQIRYYKLMANLKIQGVSFAKVYLCDGIGIRARFGDYFDKVLLDAPCSCEGRFYVQEPRTFKYWKERKVKEMSHKQKGLIFSAISSLKENGELVYSTCTFSPEENEEIVNWALEKFKNLEIIPLEIPLANAVSGLTTWCGRKFSSSLKLTSRIIPNNFMEGFFIAKMRKLKGGC